MVCWVYHERQESQLCGQHCLNNLLQGPFFNAIDLAEIARELDAAERRLGAVSYINASANVDDSGNFSIQVLRVALQRFNNSDLIPWFQKKGEADVDVTQQKGIIVNRSNHWFTIRKINNHWFNLNSTIDRPEYISDFALSAFLASLRAEGYSVFLAQGNISDAGNPKDFEYIGSKTGGAWYSEDDLFHSNQLRKSDADVPLGFQAFRGAANRLGGNVKREDDKIVDLSSDIYDEELELAKAISASLQPTVPTGSSDGDDIRAKRLAALSKLGIR